MNNIIKNESPMLLTDFLDGTSTSRFTLYFGIALFQFKGTGIQLVILTFLF